MDPGEHTIEPPGEGSPRRADATNRKNSAAAGRADSDGVWRQLWPATVVEVLAGLVFSAALGVLFWKLTDNSEERRSTNAERVENLRFVRSSSGETTETAGYDDCDPSSESQRRPFRSLDLRGQSLAGLALSCSDFTDAILEDADFYNADLRGSILEDARMARATLVNADMQGVTVRETDLRDADLGAADLDRSILIDVDMSGAQLGFVSLRDLLAIGGVDLTGASLVRADLSGIAPRPGSGIRCSHDRPPAVG